MLIAFVAGVLSILSPCVLPLVPTILAGAVAQHRLAPLALAAGLAISFSVIGLFVATIGFSIGLDTTVFRNVAAALMILFGAVLLVPVLQLQFALATGPIANWAGNRSSQFVGVGFGGQFGVGLLLGAIWTPCVGPALGAAATMAARGENLIAVAATMLSFGIGTALPLLILATLSRKVLMRWRGEISQVTVSLKRGLGLLLILVGLLTLTGLDHPIQTALTRILPSWLVSMTTQF